MTPRFARLCSAGLLLVGLSYAFAQAPAPLPQNPPAPRPVGTPPVATPAAAAPSTLSGPIKAPTAPVGLKPGSDDPLVSLNLPDADIDTVLSTLEMFTGKIILRPAQLPTAQNGYNLKIKKQIPRSEAVLYLETILAMNNIAVLPMGEDALKIVQLTQSRVEAPELIETSTLDLPPSSRVASKLFQLEFLRVAEFQQMLQSITNPNFGGAMPLVNANAILITDTVSNLQRIELLLQKVDRPVAGGLATKFYPLKNGAKASDVVTKLGAILRTLTPQLGAATSYSADDRTNQVILITDERQFPFFDSLIEKLDIRSDPNTRNEVVNLRHAKASDLVQVLIRLIQQQNQVTSKSQSARPVNSTQPGLGPTPLNQPPSQGPAAPPGPLGGSGAMNPNLGDGNSNEFSSLVTVVNDDRSNSIVVSGTVDDIRLIKELISQLDNVLPQVRIEVVIAEVTLDDNHQSGIDTLGLKVDGDRLVGFTSGGQGFSFGGTDGTAGSFAGISRIGGPGSLARSLDLVGIVNLGTTPRKNNSTILSVPTLTTSHAHEANIFVGETHPIVSGSVNNGVNGGTTSTTTQQKIGINLTVTPLIGSDGSVQLDIQQDVDEVGPNVTIDGNPVPIIFTRTTKSFVSVKSEDIIVLGGLQRKVNSRSTSRLGPIPILGDLLGTRTKDEKRTELVFFIRPHVLSNSPSDNVSTLKRVDELPQRDEILQHVDPNFQPKPKHPVLDKILPR